MTVAKVLLGIIILFMGRELFWFFVGVVGGVFGFRLALHYLHGQPHWEVLVAALAAGVLGAILAIYLQRFAVAAAAFLAGGSSLPVLLGELGLKTGHLHWPLFFIGGIVGALMSAILFDWALIILSSLTGAVLILSAIHVAAIGKGILFIVLFASGFVIQSLRMKKRRPPKDQKPD